MFYISTSFVASLAHLFLKLPLSDILNGSMCLSMTSTSANIVPVSKRLLQGTLEIEVSFY